MQVAICERYNGSGYFFMISRSLLQPEVARIVAHMIFATLQLTCDAKRDLWNQSRSHNTRRRGDEEISDIFHSIEAWAGVTETCVGT